MMKTITANGKTFDLYWITGKVMNAGKNMETRVHGGGGGGFTYQGTGGSAPVTISSTTVIHDQIFLEDAQGQEHAFQLQNFNVACREGNALSIIWAIRKGKSKGPYIVVYNRTTSQAYFNNSELNRMFRYPVWYVLAGIVVCLILGKAVGILYAGLLVIPIAWLILGSMAARSFKEKLQFAEFK